MYGYMLLSGKFYELGEIKLGNCHSCDGSILAFPLDDDSNDKHIWSRGSKYWKMSPNEGEVYDCKTVWLANDDVDLAKKLITDALKAKRDVKIKEAKAKYQKAVNALNRIDF